MNQIHIKPICPEVWWIESPLGIAGLPSVNLYIIGDHEGHYLIDTGWNSSDRWSSLRAILEQTGFHLSTLRGVILTHHHPDHSGLAAHFRGATQAWIGMHPRETQYALRRYGRLRPSDDAVEGWLADLGVPPSARAEMIACRMSQQTVVTPDRKLRDGQSLQIGSLRLEVLHTPGHTPGHLSIVVADRGLVLTGDHILPHITPHIGGMSVNAESPILQHMRSLDLIMKKCEEDWRVLPGHGGIQEDLGDCVRRIEQNHLERLREVTTLWESESKSSWEIARRVSWSRPWGALSGHHRFLALRETDAYVKAMQSGVSANGET